MKLNCLLAVFLVVASVPASQLTDAIISPVGTFQAILDPRTSTIFNCTVRGAAVLVWRIDKIPAEDQRIGNRGISVGNVITLIDNDLQGYITIPNTMVNNQSSVVCVAMNIPGIEPPEVNSEQCVLQLLVQESRTDLVTTDSSVGLTSFRTDSNSKAMSSSIGSVTIIACVSAYYAVLCVLYKLFLL